MLLFSVELAAILKLADSTPFAPFDMMYATIAELALWVYETGKSYNFIKTKTLRKMIADKLYKRIVRSGDGNFASCYLFDLDLFLENCIEPKDIFNV